MRREVRKKDRLGVGSGCAPSLPDTETIPTEDGAHPGRGWRTSFFMPFQAVK